MTEEEVAGLAQAPNGERESNPEPNEKPSLWDYVRAFFDSLPGPSSSF
jgi:hypothetical protein